MTLASLSVLFIHSLSISVRKAFRDFISVEILTLELYINELLQKSLIVFPLAYQNALILEILC